MTQITHLRDIPALRPLGGLHPAVVVRLDDPAPLQSRREECPQSGADVGQRPSHWS